MQSKPLQKDSLPLHDGKITKWVKITAMNIDKVKPGDQVQQMKGLNSFDGIVIHVSLQDKELTILRYTWPGLEIKPVTVKVGANRLWKAEYSGSCFSDQEVIWRATLRIYEKKYNFIYNRAKHFSKWCKTGYGGLLNVGVSVDCYKKEIKVSDVKEGDHLCFKRKGGYCHHGIVTYIDDNKYILAEYKKKGVTEDDQTLYIVETEKDYNGDETFQRVVHDKEDTTEETVKRAKYMVAMFKDRQQSEMQKLFRYNLGARNCEHLATWCKTGYWASMQVKQCAQKAVSEVLYIPQGQLTMYIGRVHIFEAIFEAIADKQNYLLARIFDLIGPAFYVVVELSFLLYEYYQYKEKQKTVKNEDKKLNLKKEWLESVKRRLIHGGSSALGGFIGAYFGQYGTFVGWLIGFIVGNITIHKSEIKEWCIILFEKIKDWPWLASKPDEIKKWCIMLF